MNALRTFFAANKDIITTIVVVLILFSVTIWAWKSGFFKNILKEGPKNDPNLTDAENARARALAVILHDDMKGPAFRRNMEAWREFMGLRDAVARQIYNVFGQLYYDEHKQTLTDWVADEWQWQDPIGIASQQQVMERLALMGLTPSMALVRTLNNDKQGRVMLPQYG